MLDPFGTDWSLPRVRFASPLPPRTASSKRSVLANSSSASAALPGWTDTSSSAFCHVRRNRCNPSGTGDSNVTRAPPAIITDGNGP